MVDELQRKIAWLKKRHEDQSKIVEEIENGRRLNRGSTTHKDLRDAKKEKLRLKDHVAWLKKLESRLQKN